MYLTYIEYNLMGGTLDETAFNTLNRRAQRLINAQAGGKTGERIGKLAELPQAVLDCVFDLIAHLSENSFGGQTVQSESQSLGVQSESYTYARLTKDETDAETESIIFDYLYPVKIDGVSILYRGADA